MRWLAAASLAAALAVAVPSTPGAGANADPPAGRARSEVQSVGVFTGEYANGMPVYRFPPVTVVATRTPELRRTACEERPAPTDDLRAESLLDRACGSGILAAVARNVWTP